MKAATLIITGTTLSLAVSSALADRVEGTAKANFRTDELSIPCVMIEEHSDMADGMYYDIVLERRGNSFNYELSFAEPEDPVLCERIGDLAEFEEDDESNTPEILVQCEIEGNRSEISVKGKNLEEGEYLAAVYSGDNSVESLTMSSDGDEVEFEFDTDEEAVMEGAEPIESDFIVDGEVTAEIWLADADTATLVSDATACKVEEPDDEEEEDDDDTEEGEGS